MANVYPIKTPLKLTGRNIVKARMTIARSAGLTLVRNAATANGVGVTCANTDKGNRDGSL